MRSYLTILLLLISCLGHTNLFSQEYHTSSNKALKLYKQGIAFYDFVDYTSAEDYFKQALDVDDKFYEAYLMLGELFSKQKRYAEAAGNYIKAVRIDSLFYKPVFFNLANAELLSGAYKEALIHYNVYIVQKGISENNKSQAIKNIADCEFAIEAMKEPVPFNPVSVGNGINTTADEYWPSITADGKTLIFTRQSNLNGKGKMAGQEDFYISYLTDGKWSEALNAGSPLNTSNNEGAQSLSANGAYMFFTACNSKSGLGSCDIFFSAFRNGKWSVPVNLGSPVNTSYWESQPSISADGKMLFFSSNRPGGAGGKDLWYSILDDKGKWLMPLNMGEAINTSSDEMSPFIHFDGKTLYFSSDGRPGMGGDDIYMTKMQKDSSWSIPQNLGYPINTCNDETGLVIESDGQKAYFSSKHDDKEGKNIFSFELYKSIQPDPVAYLKGRVTDRETGKILIADYELINLSTGKSIVSNVTDEKGDFLVCIPSGYNYGLNVSRKEYLFHSENFMFEGNHSVLKPYLKQIRLSPLKTGEKMLLSNVFYETDSWQLKKESMAELNRLSSLLEENSDLMVEIGGYTDSTGSDEYNLSLSEKRARSVVDYLIENGIKAGRLKYRGYGNNYPIGDNVTPEGRQLNRRTEVKILEFNRKKE